MVLNGQTGIEKEDLSLQEKVSYSPGSCMKADNYMRTSSPISTIPALIPKTRLPRLSDGNGAFGS